MKYNDIVNEIIALHNETFHQKHENLFLTQLRPENCFFPGIRKLENNRYDIEQVVTDYYAKLSFLLDSIIKNETFYIVKWLLEMKQFLSKYDLTLTDFICCKGFFRGASFFYTQTDDPFIFAVYTTDSWLSNDKQSPELFKKLEFECLTKTLCSLLQEILIPYADAEFEKLIVEQSWDQIDFSRFQKRIQFKIKSECKEDYKPEDIPDCKTYEQMDINLKREWKAFFDALPEKTDKVKTAIRYIPGLTLIQGADLTGMSRAQFARYKKDTGFTRSDKK